MDAQGGAQDPVQQIIAAAQQAVETNDTQLAMQVCQALVQLAQGGAEQPAAGGEEQYAEPTEAGGGEPVYGRGGKLLGRLYR